MPLAVFWATLRVSEKVRRKRELLSSSKTRCPEEILIRIPEAIVRYGFL
jgi:hypothetical protein